MSTRNSPGDEIPQRDVALFAIVSFTRRRHTGRVVTPLALTLPMEGFPWDDLHKILHGGQRLAKVQNGEETLPKVSTT